MPRKLRDMPKFETNNSLSISMMMALFCCHRSKLKGNFQRVFLLPLTDGLNSQNCLITSSQNSMHKFCRFLGKVEKGRRTNFGVNCLHSIGKIITLIMRLSACEDNQHVRIVMPLEELKLEMVNFEKTQRCPFVVYADLEALKFSSKSCQREKYGRHWTSSPGQLWGHSSGWSNRFCFCRVLLPVWGSY